MNNKIKIAIYGLSTETERVLPILEAKYYLAGLLDGFRTDGKIYGRNIISIEEAIEARVAMIIVVARPGSCKVIAKRIGNACKEHNIELFDIRGRDLLGVNRIVYDFKAVRGYHYSEVLEHIQKAEAVSFDLFDTLVMRQVMSVNDVIVIMEDSLRAQGVRISNFSEKRIAAEKQLSQGTAPKLTAIYEEVFGWKEVSYKKHHLKYDKMAGELAKQEFEIDKKLLIPRADTIKLLDKAKQMGKKVYITTDSYYTKEQIEEILLGNGIRKYNEILVSSEYGTSKQQELFARLRETAGTDNILHIGDDIVSDIQSAKINGIDCIRLYSSAALLDFAGGLGLLESVETLTDRVKVGMFISRIFNSPFQFEDEAHEIRVKTAFDIGYLLCAPVITDFCLWFGRQVQKMRCKNVWFCARDGFLIKQLYKKIYEDLPSEYLLSSRIAAIRAGVESEEDIAYVDSMKFSGTLEQNLKCRFGIDAAEILENEMDYSKDGLLIYSRAILKEAAVKREYNQRYLFNNIKLYPGKIVFFDFVAKGTSQMYIQRLIENEMTGLYFLQLEPDYMKNRNLFIEPFYTEKERDESAIFNNYFILEPILTSPEPSVREFDSEGKPVYAEETRSARDMACFTYAQDGIREYVNHYLSICPVSHRSINKKLDEAFLMLIHHVKITDKDFLSLSVEDPFFNRMTEITDML